MNFLKKPFKFGQIVLPNNIFFSPLAGCSDYPFRKMATAYRPGLFFCEMVKMDALLRYDKNTFHLLDYDADMHPIGAQLCGSDPKFAGPSAKIIEDLGFDVVDFNCGCPVDKVTKDGSGSGMLKNPQKIGQIISNMVASVKIPVTVKVRAGWDDDTIVVEEITKIAEEAGATAIAVHARTREQGYTGGAKWDYIRRSKTAANKILVIGNGDVFSKEAGLKMFEETGCDAIMASRATMGEPWIAEEIVRFLEGNCLRQLGPSTYRDALMRHFHHVKTYSSTRRALLDMRRVGCWYLKNADGIRCFRGKMSKAESLEEIEKLIETCPME